VYSHTANPKWKFEKVTIVDRQPGLIYVSRHILIMIRRVLAVCFTLTVLGALVGCGVPKGMAKRAARTARVSSGKLSLQVALSSAANQNSPVAVDVLLIKDKSFLKTAQGLSANDWFVKKLQLQRQFPNGMEVRSWEWVPGQSVKPISFVVPVDTQGAMMFANYASAGPHSAPLPVSGKIVIFLDDDDFTIQSK
jgi:type VI secretion system protein